MWGLVAGALIVGTVVLVRVVRRTRTGRRMGESLRGLTTGEKASVVFTVMVFGLIGSSVATAWVAWQIENAQIIAGVREPRSRPVVDRTSPSDGIRDFTVPSISLPEFPDHARPSISLPEFPDQARPSTP